MSHKKKEGEKSELTVVQVNSALDNAGDNSFTSSSEDEEEDYKGKSKVVKPKKKEKSGSDSESASRSKGKSVEKPSKKYRDVSDVVIDSNKIGVIPSNRLQHLKTGEWHSRKGKKAQKIEKEHAEMLETLEHYNLGDFSFVEREAEKEAAKAKFGIRISFACNVVLTVIKVIVLIMSGSISIFASLLDSILDLISGSIIIIANRLQKLSRKEYYKYPVGKRRLETLAVIVFSAAMFTATGELLIRSVERIVDPASIELSFDYTSIGLVTAIIMLKFGLWLICRRAEAPSVQALAQDHINDVFTNAVGIFCALTGYYFWPLMDPVGGLLLGLFIMVNWAKTGIENVQLMTGKSADPEFLSILTGLAMAHHPKIKAIDSCRAYFVSNRIIVELDILLPEDMSLKEAHDIGEALQNKIEKLPDIERAFVHLDFEVDHRHLDEHPTLKALHEKFNSKEGLINLDESTVKPPK